MTRVTVRAADFGTSMPIPNAFSHTGPAGWSVNSTTYDAYGVCGGATSVCHCSATRITASTSGKAGVLRTRIFGTVAAIKIGPYSQRAVGTVAVADGDEWDDLKKDATGADIPRQGFHEHGNENGQHQRRRVSEVKR